MKTSFRTQVFGVANDAKTGFFKISMPAYGLDDAAKDCFLDKCYDETNANDCYYNKCAQTVEAPIRTLTSNGSR